MLKSVLRLYAQQSSFLFSKNRAINWVHKVNYMSSFSSSGNAAEGTIAGGYVDVHAHLIHDKFKGIEDEVALKCKSAGVEFVVVNGLEPVSNRAVLDLCTRHSPYLLTAMGIYPLDAACNVITEETWKHPFPPPDKFDVDAEIDFIDEMAAQKLIVAVGECGLDKHYLSDEVSMNEQERVLRKLMKVSL